MSELESQIKKRNRQMALTIVGIVVVAAIIFGGGAYLFTRAFTGHIRTVDDLETMTLEESTYTDDLAASGTLQAAESVVVSPEVEGTVTEVLVKDGSKVAEGDTLFTMENETLTKATQTAKTAYEGAGTVREGAQEKLTSAKATLKTAKQKYKAAQGRLADAQEALEEQQEEDPGYTADLTAYEDAVELAQDSVNTAQTGVDSATETYESAKESLALAKQAYDDAKAQEAKLTVKAGTAGTVANVNVKAGASAATLNATGGALEIVDMDTIVAVIQVPEASVALLSVGRGATLTCPSLGDDLTFSATVTAIADTPSATTGTEGGVLYDVTLALGDLSGRAKVGMAVNATITMQDFGTVYYVPPTAVATGDAGPYVEVVSPDASTTEVQVTEVATAEDGRLIIQSSSLHAGDLVRTDLS